MVTSLPATSKRSFTRDRDPLEADSRPRPALRASSDARASLRAPAALSRTNVVRPWPAGSSAAPSASPVKALAEARPSERAEARLARLASEESSWRRLERRTRRRPIAIEIPLKPRSHPSFHVVDEERSEPPRPRSARGGVHRYIARPAPYDRGRDRLSQLVGRLVPGLPSGGRARRPILREPPPASRRSPLLRRQRVGPDARGARTLSRLRCHRAHQPRSGRRNARSSGPQAQELAHEVHPRLGSRPRHPLGSFCRGSTACGSRAPTAGRSRSSASAPGQARIECLGCELFDIGYFRQSMRTVFLTMLEHFGSTSVVRLGPTPAPGECHFHLHWA